MPQSEKVKIFDQLWRLVKLGEFVALQEENFLTLSVSGESREESLHRADLLCAVIRAMRSPATVRQLLVIAVNDRLVKVRAIVDLGEHKAVTPRKKKEVRNEFSSSPILYFSRYYINSFIISINNHARLCFRHFFYVFLQSIINRYIR